MICCDIGISTYIYEKSDKNMIQRQRQRQEDGGAKTGPRMVKKTRQGRKLLQVLVLFFSHSAAAAAAAQRIFQVKTPSFHQFM